MSFDVFAVHVLVNNYCACIDIREFYVIRIQTVHKNCESYCLHL